MVAPDFGRLGLRGEIAKTHHGAAAVRCGQVKAIMQRRRNKFHHLRKLTGGNKGAVGFGDHKQAIEGQAADIGKGVGQAHAAHGFNGMNKKTRERYHTLPPGSKNKPITL